MGISTLPIIGIALAFVISAILLPSRAAASRTLGDAAAAGERIQWHSAGTWLVCMFVIGQLLSAVEVGALPLAERAGAAQGVAALLIAV